MSTHELLAEMESGLEGTTKGQWTAFYKHKYDEWHVSVPVEGSSMKLALWEDGCPLGESYAKWIALCCSPDNIARIIAWRREMEADRDRTMGQDDRRPRVESLPRSRRKAMTTDEEIKALVERFEQAVRQKAICDKGNWSKQAYENCEDEYDAAKSALTAQVAELRAERDEAREYGKQARLRENEAEDARVTASDVASRLLLRVEAAEAHRDRLVSALREELAKVAYQPGDHPVVPVKHDAFVKAVQRIVDDAALSASGPDVVKETAREGEA